MIVASGSPIGIYLRRAVAIVTVICLMDIPSAAHSAQEFDWTHAEQVYPPSQTPTPKEVETVRHLIAEGTTPAYFGAYAKYIIDTASHWRGGQVAQTYTILRDLETHLDSDAEAYPDITFSLAREYLALGLPWRAKHLLERTPPQARGKSFSDLRDELVADDDTLRRGVTPGSIPSLLDSTALFDPTGESIESRLFGVVLADPNGENEEIDLDPLQLCVGAGCEERADILSESATLNQAPLLMTTKRTPDDTVLGNIAISRFRIDQRQDTPLTQFALTSSEAILLRQILDAYKSGKSTRLGDARLSNVPPFGPAKAGAIQQLVSVRYLDSQYTAVTVSISDGDDGLPIYYVALLHSSPAGLDHALVGEFYEDPDIDYLDILGNGLPDVVVQTRGGSGGYLSVAVIDPRSAKLVWDVAELEKGSVEFLNLDQDPALEIVARERIGAPGMCYQCPGPNDLVLLDFKADRGTYIPVSYRRPLAYYLSGSGVGPFGITDAMAIDNVAQAYQVEIEALKSATGPIDTQDIANALGRSSYYVYLLMSDHRYDEAVQVLNNITVVVTSKADASVAKEIRIQALFGIAEALLREGHYEDCQKLLADPWLENSIKSDPERRAVESNIKGISAALSGNMAASYVAFDEAERISTKRNSEVEGNLSYYYQLVNDYPRAKQRALDALDAAAVDRDPSGMSADELHLARVATRQHRFEEAIDWASLSASYADRVELMDVLADIAVTSGRPKVAIALLDEELASMSRSEWQFQGPSFLLRYGLALEALGMTMEAKDIIQTAASMPNNHDPATAVAAYASLAEMARSQGDAANALRWATTAFQLSLAGRARIGPEQHKFSFLTNEAHVAELYFSLLIAAGTSPRELFESLEQYKMQVFLDTAVEGGAKPNGQAATLPILTKMLSDGDLFLDYMIGDALAFCLTVNSDGVVSIVPLEIRGNKANELAMTVRQGMNLQNSKSIRSGSMSNELSDSLSQLYSDLIGPLALNASVQRIIISPDSAIFGLPWGALLESKPRSRVMLGWDVTWLFGPYDSAFLVDRYQIAILPSARVGITLADRKVTEDQSRANVTLVGAFQGVEEGMVRKALGTSVLPEEAVQPLLPIRGGIDDLKRVAADLSPSDDVTFLVDRVTGAGSASKISEPNLVRQYMASSNIVHILAHGAFNTAQPMQSAIFLDGGAVLTADSLNGFNSRLDLISLAVCETAKSGIEPGAEPIGFLRSFLSFGARTAVLTEWAVDRTATNSYFDEFYRNIGTHGKGVAARMAQLKVRKTFRHPYFWAGIQLYGLW